MNPGLWLAVGVALGMGYGLVASLGISRPLVLVASLSVGLGLGSTSCLYFAWCLFGSARERGYIGLELACLALLLTAGFWRRRNRRDPSPGRVTVGAAPGPLWWTIAATFTAAVLLTVAMFVIQSLANPSGEWDAWAIWTNRATLIYRAGHRWLPLIRQLPEAFNPSYPLLLPLSISRLWLYAQEETPFAAVSVAGLLCLATVGLISAGVSAVRRQAVQGFLAGLVVLSTPLFVPFSVNQYADLPVGFFFLATAVLWAWAETGTDGRARARIALAGCAAALAAWTKNEGMLFLAAAIAVMTLRVVPAADRRKRGVDLLAFVAGAIPVLLVVAWFKTAYAPPDRWAAQLVSAATLDKITDPSRYGHILMAAVSDFQVFPWPLLAVYGLLMGIVPDTGIHRAAYVVGTLLVLLAAGYATVFLTSPWDLTWHLRTAWTRTSYQLWPLGVFFTFLILKGPQTASR